MPTPPSAVKRRSTRSGSPYEDACDPDPAVQARRCWEIAATALRDLGADPGHVVRTRMYVTDAAVTDEVGRVHGEVFDAVRPAATMVVVAGLVHPRWHVEVEAEALVSEEGFDPSTG